MTARTRLAALVVATLTVLAVVTVGDQVAQERDLRAVPAVDVGTGLPHAGYWCERWKPHTGDTVTFSAPYDGYSLAGHIHVFRCAAAHPGGAPGTGHFWDVLVWDRNGDGVAERVEWVPLGPWWT